jgi:hypothetical protein
MQLVEVMMAAAVFTAASGGSLQVFARMASSSQQAELRQRQLERIELDRLQLQALWRRELLGQAVCISSIDQIRAMAATLPPPPQVVRDLRAGDQVDELRLRWRFEGEPGVVRERLLTMAGLGASCKATAPLTDSPVEGVE